MELCHLYYTEPKLQFGIYVNYFKLVDLCSYQIIWASGEIELTAFYQCQ